MKHKQIKKMEKEKTRNINVKASVHRKLSILRATRDDSSLSETISYLLDLQAKMT